MTSEQVHEVGITTLICLSFVAAFGMMADCSKQNAREDGRMAALCVKAGGKWNQFSTTTGRSESFCTFPSPETPATKGNTHGRK